MKAKTVKQIIASFLLLLVTLSLLNLIKTKLEESKVDHYINVMSANKIQDDELFKYALDTNLSNIIAYGKVEAIGSVSMNNLEGNYMIIERVQEEEHLKSRLVSYSCGKDGKDTCWKLEYYWEWDVMERENASVSDVSFMGIHKPIGEYKGLGTSYTDTFYYNSRLRDKFYTVELDFNALIHLDNKDSTYNLKRTSLEKYIDVTASVGWVSKFIMIVLFLIVNGFGLYFVWIEYDMYFD